MLNAMLFIWLRHSFGFLAWTVCHSVKERKTAVPSQLDACIVWLGTKHSRATLHDQDGVGGRLSGSKMKACTTGSACSKGYWGHEEQPLNPCSCFNTGRAVTLEGLTGSRYVSRKSNSAQHSFLGLFGQSLCRTCFHADLLKHPSTASSATGYWWPWFHSAYWNFPQELISCHFFLVHFAVNTWIR